MHLYECACAVFSINFSILSLSCSGACIYVKYSDLLHCRVTENEVREWEREEESAQKNRSDANNCIWTCLNLNEIPLTFSWLKKDRPGDRERERTSECWAQRRRLFILCFVSIFGLCMCWVWVFVMLLFQWYKYLITIKRYESRRMHAIATADSLSLSLLLNFAFPFQWYYIFESFFFRSLPYVTWNREQKMSDRQNEANRIIYAQWKIRERPQRGKNTTTLIQYTWIIHSI